ncbi:hypothetical protein ACFQI7_01980 [Paenibacillus allorhizosphaerae]|uniref:DUF4367 domain-containing protein n=1 Tax=Paenibacillus allorhizosphaerae TaxID=2849866 RepID=A0ABM8VAP1_9BACL|nr:hypothetical protein [Paenibacillus allorhizosphaerae]CAG7617039.1 hypothetical protein PAECIP111802_00357 [Paenibacillus allorhizosphaerae]
MSSDMNDNRDKQRTDAAWTRLQSRLATEPVQPKWTNELAVPQSAEAQTGEELRIQPVAAKPAGPLEAVPAEALSRNTADKSSIAPSERKRFAWFRNRRKQWIAATACCVLAALIASPFENEALAAILNKFRMQEVTVVQENDLRDLFNQISADGKTREQINQFGTFTQTGGKLQGQFTPEEAAKALGFKLAVPKELKDSKETSVYVSPSNKLTFALHVDEVNKALKRLGAKKLLPASVNGKPITLEIGEGVNYNFSNGDKKKYASFSQQNVPVVTVDPSIPVSEALSAVLDLPVLPEHLKQALKQSNMLSGGSAPFPVIASGQTETIRVNDVNVTLAFDESKDRSWSRYSATWVKDGQLFNFNGGNMYMDKDAVLKKIKELMES